MQTRRLHRLGQGANENGLVDPSDDRLWVVDLGGGQLRIVQGHDALMELIGSQGLSKSARVYELAAVPKTLGEILEVAPAFESAAPAPAPPPAKGEVEIAPPPSPPTITSVEPSAPAEETRVHNGSHDADFSLLDRPFEDDSDYFEDPPRQWPRIVGAIAALVLLVGGGYKLLQSRHAPSASAAPEPTFVAAAPPPASEPAPTSAPAAPAPAAAPASPPVAAAPVAAAAAPVAAAAPAAPVAPARVEQRLPDSPPPSKPVANPPAAPSGAYAELVAEGQRLFERGHGRKAQALFEQALAEQPDGVEALVGLAYAQLDRGKMQEAIGSFKRALDRDGSQAHAVFGLAESYRQLGNRSAALAAFKRFLKLQPSGGDADIARRLVQDLSGGG